MLQRLADWSATYPYTSLLLFLMFWDVVTGLLRAIQERKLSSDINGRGMRRKATMLILVLIGKALERVTGPAPIAEAIAVGFCVSEGLSILENATLLGAPVPPFLTRFFLQLQHMTASTTSVRLGDSQEDVDRILAARQAGHTKNEPRPDVTENLLDHIEKDGVG